MKLKHWQLAGAVFTLILGTFLHFAYALSGENAVVGAFSPVNESTWEHLKMLITPMLLFAVTEYFAYGKKYSNFIPVRFVSILFGTLVILFLFYTYTGIAGRHFLPADIGIYILGVLAAYLLSYKLLRTDILSSDTAVLVGAVGLALLIFCVVAFTRHPPDLPLFRPSES